MNHVFSSIVCVINKDDAALAFLQESVNLAKTWNSNLRVVVCDTLQHFSIERLSQESRNFDPLGEIEFVRLESSVREILKLLKYWNADLLVLQGDDQSELDRYYNKSLMRKLIRNADCSILIKKAEKESHNYENLVLNGFEHPKLKSTVVKAQSIRRSLKVKSMLVMNQKKDSKLPLDYYSPLSNGNYEVEQKEVDKNGFQISELVRSRNANLLIMNSPDTKLGFEGRFFSDELDFLISDLPSDILLVHSTKMNS